MCWTTWGRERNRGSEWAERRKRDQHVLIFEGFAVSLKNILSSANVPYDLITLHWIRTHSQKCHLESHKFKHIHCIRASLFIFCRSNDNPWPDSPLVNDKLCPVSYTLIWQLVYCDVKFNSISLNLNPVLNLLNKSKSFQTPIL